MIRTEKLTLEEAQQEIERRRHEKVAEVEDFLTLVLETAEEEGGEDVDGWLVQAVRGARRSHHARQGHI